MTGTQPALVTRRLFAALLLFLLSCPLFGAGDSFLFTSFRKNGETGVYLALSSDGRRWTPLNNNQPWIKPEHAGMLMRDPFLVQGPDRTWHLLWTWGWTRDAGALRIGYSSSTDLLNWTPQREIAILPDEPTARNAWAPEAVWDSTRKQWIVFWSTTIPGRFPDTEKTGDNGYNHRIYAMTTPDWKTFSAPFVWFDPGFNCIDATVVQDGARWIMVFKDERKSPLQKKLRLAFAGSPSGPWRDVTEPSTRDWVEGPSAVQIRNEWWVYFDHYTQPHFYGAVRTRDWKTFEDMSDRVSFPPDHKHGTVVKIPAGLAATLEKERRP